MRKAVAGLKGQVSACGSIDTGTEGERQPLLHASAALQRLQRAVKTSFDPAGVLNPGVFGYE